MGVIRHPSSAAWEEEPRYVFYGCCPVIAADSCQKAQSGYVTCQGLSPVQCGASVHTPSTGTGGGRALDETGDRLSPTMKEWQRQALRRGGSRNGVARLLGGSS